MARRMFSPKIVSSDAFLDMPISTQALYFHLGMEADDDGFVNPKKTMRMIGASDDDLKVLSGKRFVLPFENGVVVIKHWLINNMIRKDFYKETVYTEQKERLKIKDNGSYTENVNKMLTETTHRIGKVRLGNTTIAPAIAAPFVWKDYLNQMFDDKKESIQIIAFYFQEKKITFDTVDQARTAVKRHLRAANEVAKFPEEKVRRAMKIAVDQYKDIFTIETLLKILTR